MPLRAEDKKRRKIISQEKCKESATKDIECGSGWPLSQIGNELKGWFSIALILPFEGKIVESACNYQLRPGSNRVGFPLRELVSIARTFPVLLTA